MYYIRAEANLQGGLSIGDTPINDINKVRERAGLTPLATVTLDDILNERRKEFFLEGHRRLDLLRNGRDLRPAGNPQAALATFGADRTIFQYPRGNGRTTRPWNRTQGTNPFILEYKNLAAMQGFFYCDNFHRNLGTKKLTLPLKNALMRIIANLLFFLMVFSVAGQTPTDTKERDSIALNSIETDSTQTKPGARALPTKAKVKDSARAIAIQDYKIISFQRDTTFLDTTLTIAKEYKYNYLRTDDFELMPLGNIGQAYNALGLDVARPDLFPELGAQAKHPNYWEIEDMTYYNVPTPMTDILFKTTLEQGQLLDALLTFNTSPGLNFSLGYKGHRSLGKYQFAQIQSGNFTATANYASKNGRYALRAHIAAQDIKSEENAGWWKRNYNLNPEILTLSTALGWPSVLRMRITWCWVSAIT